MPSPQLQVIIQMLQARPLHEDISAPEMREEFEQVATLFPVPDEVQRQPLDVAGVPGEWIAAPGASPDRVLLYLHGGGYTVGSINTHRDLVARISRAAGARALSVNYRLAPEHPFPAAVEDAKTAYRWLLAQGISPQRIVVGGDSAGGGLTVAALVALRDEGGPLPAAAVCLSPWTDMEGKGESMKTKAAVDPMVQEEPLLREARIYVGDADPRHPLASPIHADLHGLPPLLIQVGTAEVLLDDSTRLAARARAAGVDVTLEPWDDMIHVWQFFAAMLPEGQQAIDRIGEFIRQRVGEPVAGERAAAS